MADYLSPVVAELVAKTDKFRSEMMAAQRSMGAVEKAGGSSFDKLAKVGKASLFGLGAAAVGFGAIAVKQAQDQEAANARLSTALANVGSTLTASSKPFQDAEAAARKLGFEDDQATDSLAKLTAATRNPAKALRDLALAEDVARGRNIDLASATDIVNKVETGHVALLGRIGINTKDATGATISQEEALRRLSDLYGGQASAYSKTFAGRMATLRAETNELAENVGNFLIPKIETLAHAGNASIEWLGKHTVAARALAVVVGGPLLLAMSAYALAQAKAASAKLAELFGSATRKALAMKDAIIADAVAMSALDAATLGAAAVLTAGITVAVVELNKNMQKQIDVAKNAGDAFAHSYVDKIGDAPNKVELVTLEIAKLVQQQYVHGGQTEEEREAITALQKQLQDWASESRGAAAADTALGDKQDETALSADQLAQKVEGLRSSLTGQIAAQKSYHDSLSRVDEATKSVTEAHRAVDEAISKAVVDTRAAAAAARDLRDADESVATAEGRVVTARQKLADLSKGAAPHDLAEAQLRVSETARGVERAHANLAERQKALTDLYAMGNSTLEEQRSAQLDVADAQDGITQAQLDAQDAQAALTRLQGYGKDGTDEYKQATSDLADAEKGLRDAQEGQQTAQEKLNQANTVDPSLTEAVKTAKDRLADSERGLRDAKDGVASSALAAADAEAKARDEMSKSAPAAAELRDRLDEIAAAWPAAQPAIAAIEALLPARVAPGSELLQENVRGGQKRFALGGMVDHVPRGTPVGIIAHGGEGVLNERVADLVMSGRSGSGGGGPMVVVQVHGSLVGGSPKDVADALAPHVRDALNRTAPGRTRTWL